MVTKGVAANAFGKVNLVFPIFLLKLYVRICTSILPTLIICADIESQFIIFSQLFLNSYLDRFSTMENFSKLEEERLYVPNATFIKIYKIAGMVTLIVDSGTAFFNKANTPIFNIPEKYRPNETLYFSASYRNSTKSNTFFLYSNGNLIKSEADDNQGAYYFTISYPAKTIN